MMTAFTHVLGDLLRTIAMLAAAGVSTLTGIDGDVCDATAALVVAATIVLMCGSLVSEIAGAAMEIWVEEYGDSAPPILSKSYRQRKLRLYGSSSNTVFNKYSSSSCGGSGSVILDASHSHSHSHQHHQNYHGGAGGKGEYVRLSDEEI